MSETAIILAGGDDVPPGDVGDLPADAYVIAADSGLDLAAKLGLHADIVIGDLDSVSHQALDLAERQKVPIQRHPVDKDATDLELALMHAHERNVESVIVIGGSGGRIDHFLANAGLLAAQTGIDLEWRTGTSTVHRVNGTLLLEGRKGAVVSLLAFGGPVRGIQTSGLQWPLVQEDLEPGSTRGISNRLVEEHAEVSVAYGNLLVIVPQTGTSTLRPAAY